MGVAVTRVVKFIRKGTGISRTDVEYADSTSNSVAPTSGWTTNAPAWQNGHYIWQRVRFIYTDGTDGYSNPVCLSGGKGISKIEEYYLATSASSGVTTATQGWTKAVQSVTATNKYLWNYEVVTYTDGTTTTTTPVIIGTYGDKGVGISSITEYYLATSASSGVTRSTSGWTTTVQSVTATKKYLWNYETVTYTDGSTANTDPVIIGVYGDKGDTGNGISSVVEYYLASSSSSGVTTSTTGWTTDPTATAATMTKTKKYLWNYERINYTDGTHVDTTPAIIGRFGDTGVGISSITEYYLATSASSGVTRSTSGWTTTVQSVTATKKYLWNYETVTYTDGSTANTDPVIIGVYGDTGPEGPQGPNGNDGVTYEIACSVGNVTIASDADSATLNCSAGFYRKEGTAARQAHTCRFAVYSRTGTTYALLTMYNSTYINNGYDDGVNIKANVYTGYDAVVIFMFSSAYTGTSPAGQAYLAKCEIIVKKQGNTGPQGPQGPTGGPGSQGPRGYRGPGLRGPQDWTQAELDFQFYKGADGEPYEDFVVYNGSYYKCIKTHTKTASNYPGSTYDTNNGLWQLSTKMGLVAANILFAQHGYFGSAKISGDWMISTNGTIDGTAYDNGATYQGITAYSLFNPNNPLGKYLAKYAYGSDYTFTSSNTTKSWTTLTLEAGKVYYLSAKGYGSSSTGYYIRVRNTSTGTTYSPVLINSTSAVTRAGYIKPTESGTYYLEIYNPNGLSGTVNTVTLEEKNFAPYYALDLLTGKTYQGDVYVRGGVRSPFTYLGRGGTFGNDFSDNIAVYSASASDYALPWTTDQSGRKVVITNYYWNGSYSTASGYAQLTAPAGKYFYEDGVQKSTIKLSREAVELLGYGDNNSFYGWIVLKRIDLGTESRYGHHMKMLAVGRVTGSSSGASVSYHTFDGSTMSVTRDGQGIYTLSWSNNNWYADAGHVFVMVCGYGVIDSGSNPLYASVKSQTKTSITVQTADDDSRNDGAFNFFLMNFNDWIYL